MTDKAWVAGVGMVKFAKPGANEGYEIMASKAIRAALADAGLSYEQVQEVYAGFCSGATCSGERAAYEVGMTGVPIFNVNNACATGSSALWLARRSIMSGQADCVLAVGFDEMRPGPLAGGDDGRTVTVDHIWKRFGELGYEIDPKFAAPGMFGAAGAGYMKAYNATPDIFAKVAVKTRAHAGRNPLALLDKPLTVDEVMNAPLLYGGYLTRLMACPPTCGAAAALLVSPEFARKHGVRLPVQIAGQGMATDSAATYENPMTLVGQAMTRSAAQIAYEEAGIGPRDVQVCELHDCFTTNEVISYEALGLCATGEATKMIQDGDNTYGGRVVVNPSGGLMSKGHPLGATGLAQCSELVWQLRGQADHRQVEKAKVALQHNVGLGGAAIVTVYQLA